jgi:hypothetical protein
LGKATDCGETMKKAYFWKADKDDEDGVAIVARNNREAKKIGYQYWGEEVGHDDPESFINQRCAQNKDAKVDDLPIGVLVDFVEGVRRGMYSWVEDKCPECKEEGHLTLDEDQNKVHCGCLNQEER